MAMQRLVGALALSVIFFTTAMQAQDRDDRRRDADRYWDSQHHRYTEIVPGTTITVRPEQSIDVNRRDNRVYTAIVDRDVWGAQGRLAIPRGSRAELVVRVEPDNDLVLDLESVTVRGERYATRTNTNEVESRRDNGLVGAIVGAISGEEVRGRAVRIPRHALLTFRLERPLEIGVPDHGYSRDGGHYHDADHHDGDGHDRY